MQLRKLLAVLEKFDRGEKVSKLDIRFCINYVHALINKETRHKRDNILREEKRAWQIGDPGD